MRGVAIASIGYLGLAIENMGGARKFEANLWKSFSFITRYGHQRLADVLELEEDERDLFMTALGELISEENTPSGG